MRLKLYSIRDAKGECYNTPFVQKAEGEAIRTFHKLSQDKSSMPGQYPDDYDLYHLGDFDDQTGLVHALDTPKHIIKAVNLQMV